MVKDTDISSQKGTAKEGDNITSNQEGVIQLGISNGKIIVIPTSSQLQQDQIT